MGDGAFVETKWWKCWSEVQPKEKEEEDGGLFNLLNLILAFYCEACLVVIG